MIGSGTLVQSVGVLVAGGPTVLFEQPEQPVDAEDRLE
jgi:hypothetical protein